MREYSATVATPATLISLSKINQKALREVSEKPVATVATVAGRREVNK